ncbi:carbamoyl phosphate synthase large subunit, partial [Pseudoalteromonas sp. S4491]
QGVDPIRGPEMRSTGEVMGVGETFAEAFAKAQLGASNTLPRGGRALLSVRNSDIPRIVELAKTMTDLGFELDATGCTAKALEQPGMAVRRLHNVYEGLPHILERIING